MPHQDGVLADRLGQLGVLHVHLLGPVDTVGVRVEGELALIGEILHRRILQFHLFAAHMKAAAMLDLDNIVHYTTSRYRTKILMTPEATIARVTATRTTMPLDSAHCWPSSAKMSVLSMMAD